MFNKFRKHGKIWALVIAAVMIIVFIAPFIISMFSPKVSASSLTDQVKQQQEKQKELQQKINEIDKEKQSTLEKKKLIDDVIALIQDDINEINGVISELASQIKDKEKEITTAQKLIEEKQAKFKQRVRVQYEEGSVGYIKSFFEAESMNDLLYRYAIVQEVLIHDKDLIDQMERAKRAIEEAKAAIEDNKVQTEGQKKQLDDKKRLETSKQQEQQKIINDLQKDQDAWQKQLDAAQAAEAALKRQIAANASNSNSSTYTGGKFDWPVPSSYRITSEFSAARTHPVLGVVRRHDGIDIGAPSGSNIVAAGDGTVLFAGWNGGYGNCVIIDHGGGYTTLYGHASSLLVSSGAKVSRGQVIAKVGSTGVSTGPHLHFEVCINGVAKEPTQFLK